MKFCQKMQIILKIPDIQQYQKILRLLKYKYTENTKQRRKNINNTQTCHRKTKKALIILRKPEIKETFKNKTYNSNHQKLQTEY